MALELGTLLGGLFSGLSSKKNTPLVGLDISTTGIRMVELSQGSNHELRLERCVSESLPRGAMTDGNIENIEQVSEAIRRVLKKSGTKIKEVALGMPPSAVITKKINFSAALSDESLEVQVESEASQYIPFALDEVSLDFYVIGPSRGSPDDVEVMLAAARKEKIEDRVAVVQAAGLKALVMDIESYAARAAALRIVGQMRNGGKDQIVALFQIGAKITHVSILLNGETVYEREQTFGGNQLTQDIVRTYGLTFEDAEARKKNNDLPDGYEQELLNPFLESTAMEVNRAIQFFFTSTAYTRVDHIFLAGGCAAIPDLVDMVANRTKIQTEAISPFLGMQFSSQIREKQLRNDAPAYLVACGLAMRRFD